MYKERWTGLCALGLPLDARLLDYAADHTRPPGDSPTLPAAPGAGGAPLNPFCDRGRINDSARFFGRKRIRREMEQMLAAGNSISLVGEPEVGKSSLLFLLEHTQARWLTDGTTLYLDLQGVLDEDDLCSEILDGLGCEGNGFRSLRRALRRERVVLLLDEAEMLAGDAFSARLQDRLRALSQEPTLTLAVASHRPLEHVFPRTGPTSPFHNVFTEKRMGPFAPNDARAFVAHRLGPTGVSFAASEVEWLLEESTCHPARLQRLAHRLFEEKK
jgi:hypothetical protein